MSQPYKLLPRLLLVVLAWALGQGCCPPKLQSYDTPEDVLRSWQSQLCHDDATAEYACLSSDLKRSLGTGYEVYVIARRKLLEDEPLLAAALKYFDLADRAVEREVDEASGRARFTFEHDGQRFAIEFVRETWAVADLDDGTKVARPYELPLELLIWDHKPTQRQGVEFPKPLMSDDERAATRRLLLEERWKIGGLPTTAIGSGP